MIHKNRLSGTDYKTIEAHALARLLLALPEGTEVWANSVGNLSYRLPSGEVGFIDVATETDDGAD